MTLVKERPENNKFEIQQRKAQRRQDRRRKIAAREARWVAQYEASMAACLGDPNYKLPNGKKDK